MTTAYVRTLPDLPEVLDNDLRHVIERVNGFVYPGDRADAIVDALKVLRAQPELARRLLGLDELQELPGALRRGTETP
jgi:hypothetical protein